MLIHEPISILPLVSTVVWLALAVRSVSVDRFRTWTEVFLLLTEFLRGRGPRLRYLRSKSPFPTPSAP